MMSRRPNGMCCPHCGHGTVTRSSRALAPTCRQMTIQCSNADCGASYGAQMEITHIISPSATPNPAIMLRRAPPRRVANDDYPPAANDLRGPEVPRPANDDHDAGVSTG